MLDRLFKLGERGTTVRTEALAGFTTFVTMAYIIFVNPSILKNIPGLQSEGASLTAATCLAAGLPTLVMGLWTNTPFALAPGMGLNGFLTFAVCLGQGIPWQTAMGMVFWEGVIICALVLTRTREAIMSAIPASLKHAISAGIGFFITLLGFVSAGIVKLGIADAPLKAGSLHDKGVIVAAAGLLLTLVFFTFRWRSALLLGIAATSLLAVFAGLTHLPSHLIQAPEFHTFGKADLVAGIQPKYWSLILAFVMSDFFDAMGTIVGVGQQAKLVDSGGRIARLRDILFVDGLAAVWGGVCGSSSATTYIESASGVGEGGRTGLVSVVVGVLFLLALFFAPIVGTIPPQATAPALVVVGFLMVSSIREIPFDRLEEALPSFVTLVSIPLTYSISRGIGFGFISYLLLLLATRRFRDIHPLLVVVSILFALSFALDRG